MKRVLVVLCGTRDQAAGPSGLFRAASKSQGPDAHHDSPILLSNDARVLHARIVVGNPVGVHVHILVVLSQGICIFTLRFSSKLPGRRSFFQMSSVLFVCWRRLRLVLFSPSDLPLTLLPLACLVPAALRRAFPDAPLFIGTPGALPEAQS